jgi:hypothetical protein
VEKSLVGSQENQTILVFSTYSERLKPGRKLFRIKLLLKLISKT